MAEDLQAHYRTELARMLGPEGDRYVNPKTTAWMLRHTAATEGGTYMPDSGARTWIWSDLHLHHKNIIRYCKRPFPSVQGHPTLTDDAMSRPGIAGASC